MILVSIIYIYIYTYIYIYIGGIIHIYGPVSRVPTPPPWDGGVWCPCGGVYTYIHTYIPTYLHTYVHTYIPLHYLTLHYLTLPYITLPYIPYIHTYIPYHTITLPYLTLPYLTLHYLTLHSIHTYIPTYIPTYQHTYQHTNIPTYHHHRPQGGGTRRTIPPPQATGGGDQKNHTTTTGHRGGGPEEPDDTVHPYPLVGGEGGWPTLHHIYIYIRIYNYLVGGWALPLWKIWVRQLGSLFPTEWKIFKFHGSSHHQPAVIQWDDYGMFYGLIFHFYGMLTINWCSSSICVC